MCNQPRCRWNQRYWVICLLSGVPFEHTAGSACRPHRIGGVVVYRPAYPHTCRGSGARRPRTIGAGSVSSTTARRGPPVGASTRTVQRALIR